MREFSDLMRARTRKGCTVSIDLYQSPVILYVQPEDEGSRASPLTFSVTVNGDTRQIGGITVRRQVLLRRKVPRTKNKWTEWEEIQHQEVHVVADCQVGTQRYECSMPLPARLPETRQTHYDQLIHLLTATVHDIAPEYKNHRKHSRQRASSVATLDSGLAPVEEYPRICTKSIEEVNAREPGVIAMRRKVFEVVHCSTSHGEVPTLDCEQTLRLADSGKAKVKLHSDLFVLGSSLNVGIDFLDLTHDTTIHAMSVKMVQETATPLKSELPDLSASSTSPRTIPRNNTNNTNNTANTNPSNNDQSGRSRPAFRTRISNIFAGIKDKPTTPQTSILDEYVLHSEGIDHYVTSQGFGVRPGMYLWRGEAGRNLDRPTASTAATTAMATTASEGGEGEYLDEYKLDHETPVDGILRTINGLRMNRTVRLPSEMQDAHPSSSTLAPVLARITHRIAVNVIYSVLGQDALGKPIKAGEGSMRQVTLVFQVDLMPCVVVPATIRPPIYTNLETVLPPSSPRRAIRRFSMDTIRLNRETSRTESVSAVANANAIANKATKERIIADSIYHSRAFRASNGLVVTGNRVFYSDQEVEEAVNRHNREKGACACLM